MREEGLFRSMREVIEIEGQWEQTQLLSGLIDFFLDPEGRANAEVARQVLQGLTTDACETGCLVGGERRWWEVGWGVTGGREWIGGLLLGG